MARLGRTPYSRMADGRIIDRIKSLLSKKIVEVPRELLPKALERAPEQDVVQMSDGTLVSEIETLLSIAGSNVARDISYVDDSTNLGVSNVQEAIEKLSNSDDYVTRVAMSENCSSINLLSKNNHILGEISLMTDEQELEIIKQFT